MEKNNKETLDTSKQALCILMFITFIVSGYEFLTAVRNFRPQGNIFDFCAHAVEYVPYTMIFILTLIGVLPFSLLLFRSSKIDLKKAVFEKGKLAGDIITGIIGGIISSVISLPFYIMRNAGCTYEIKDIQDRSVWFVIMILLSLVFICGCLKELYFRGFAKHFLSRHFGENTAFFMTNLLFSIVDWQNMGSSFFMGILWSWLYKKRERLIVPMIAHAMVNLTGLLFTILTY